MTKPHQTKPNQTGKREIDLTAHLQQLAFLLAPSNSNLSSPCARNGLGSISHMDRIKQSGLGVSDFDRPNKRTLTTVKYLVRVACGVVQIRYACLGRSSEVVADRFTPSTPAPRHWALSDRECLLCSERAVRDLLLLFTHRSDYRVSGWAGEMGISPAEILVDVICEGLERGL